MQAEEDDTKSSTEKCPTSQYLARGTEFRSRSVHRILDMELELRLRNYKF